MSQRRASLTLRSSVRRPARLERVAFTLLALLACVLAHEGTYLVSFGSGASYASAMRSTGHDGYWLWLVAAVVAAIAGLTMVAAVQLRRLRREVTASPTTGDGDGLRDYLSLLLGSWARLALMAGLLYTAQENAEAIAAGLPVQGVDVLLRHGLAPLVLVLLATLIVALVAALVHWRRLVLLGRIPATAHDWAPAVSTPRLRHGLRLAFRTRVPGARASRGPPRRDWSPAA